MGMFGGKKDQAAPVEAVAAARAAVERLHADELALHDKRQAAAADLTAISATVGAEVLAAHQAGGDVTDLADRTARLQAQITALDAGIDSARNNRRQAIPAVWRAESGILRAQIAKLEEEISGREERTEALLAALQDHEGVRYQPPQAPFVPAGVMADGFVLPIPRTVALQSQAATLRSQAAALDARGVQDRGALTAGSAADLLAQLRALDPMIIGPTRASVEAWATERERQAAALLDRAPSEARAHARLTLSLEWEKGAISPRSGFRLDAVAPAHDPGAWQLPIQPAPAGAA